MAKPIVVNFQGEDSSFAFTKVDRAKLFGRKRRVVLDQQGEPCRRAQLTADGSLLVLSGMTSQAYFDAAGNVVERSDLVGKDADGNLLPKVDSTLGVAQPLEGPVPAEDVLDLDVKSLYLLEPEAVSDALTAALQAGQVFRFAFNYYADYRGETGLLLSNEEGLWALIGVPSPPGWCEAEAVPQMAFEEEELDDDLDFDMF